MGVFPFLNPELAQPSQEQEALPIFQEYAYDFKNNCLLSKNGRTYLVKENEALKIWIYKALHTDRYQHIAYSRNYGNEVKNLFGQHIEEDILLPELKRYIIETLMVNPYIKELLNFRFETEGSKITVTFECKTLYGEMEPFSYFYNKGV